MPKIKSPKTALQCEFYLSDLFSENIHTYRRRYEKIYATEIRALIFFFYYQHVLLSIVSWSGNKLGVCMKYYNFTMQKKKKIYSKSEKEKYVKKKKNGKCPIFIRDEKGTRNMFYFFSKLNNFLPIDHKINDQMIYCLIQLFYLVCDFWVSTYAIYSTNTHNNNSNPAYIYNVYKMKCDTLENGSGTYSEACINKHIYNRYAKIA